MAVKKNPAASLLARLRNLSKDRKIAYQVCLQLFIQEEFLRRLSQSRYRDRLVLKGGMLLYLLSELHGRPTKDIDFMAQHLSSRLSDVLHIMKEICAEETKYTFVVIEVTGTEQISVEKNYPGVRTKLIGRISNVRVPFSIDIGIDDVVVPPASLRKIVTQLPEFPSPEILVYSLESTIAEKLDAILQRMETTSRMKDFYDIHYLSEQFDFDGSLLQDAIQQTLSHRGHELLPDSIERIAQFSSNRILLTQWNAFHPAKESGMSLEKVITELQTFLRPIIKAIECGQTFQSHWNHENKAWHSSIH